MRRAALPVSLALGMICLVSAKQQPPIKTITTGVVVDVTVVDSKGNPILDLLPQDFELSENGNRQQILSASLVHGGIIKPLIAAPDAEQAVARPAASTPTGPEISQTEVAPSVTAILFDRLSPESRDLARRAALAYVSTLTLPHDYAGVFLVDLSLRTFSAIHESPRAAGARGRRRLINRAGKYVAQRRTGKQTHLRS